MNNLMLLESNNTISSLEVAEMLETEHWEVLRKLEGYEPPKGSKSRRTIGIIPTLTDHNIGVSDYFIESTYKDGSGKENKCYLFTKMGCEFIANKFTGEKGILFTAKYVKKFNVMEMTIKDHQLLLASQRIEELETSLKNTLQNFNSSIEEAKKQFKPSHKRKLDYTKTIKALSEDEEEAQFIKDWVFTTMGYTKWEDACAGDHKRILDIIGTVSRMLAINKITLV